VTTTCIDYHFAYSHGDVTEDIGRTRLGFVGPGVKHLGRTSETWLDHSDIRPTILALLGLKDSYQPDGAVLTEFLKTSAISRDVRAHHESLERLHEVYKEIALQSGRSRRTRSSPRHTRSRAARRPTTATTRQLRAAWGRSPRSETSWRRRCGPR
jgi:arylsulfatase A-like enzyme